MIPPFDHPWIIAGQGTVGIEILTDCPEVSELLVPIGGGGLIAGVAAAIKRQKPAVRVIGVEPTGAATMKASIEEGQPVTLGKTHSIADGLLPVRPGDLTFAHPTCRRSSMRWSPSETRRSRGPWCGCFSTPSSWSSLVAPRPSPHSMQGRGGRMG